MPAPGEAWELMRISSLKTLRALQTLAKLASQLCSDISKHRYQACIYCCPLACTCEVSGKHQGRLLTAWAQLRLYQGSGFRVNLHVCQYQAIYQCMPP